MLSRVPHTEEKIKCVYYTLYWLRYNLKFESFYGTVLQFMSVYPFAIADATTLTEAGYLGEDVENIIEKRCAFTQ